MRYSTKRGVLMCLAAATGCYRGVHLDGGVTGAESGGTAAETDAADDAADDGPAREPSGDPCSAADVPRVWRLTAQQYDRTLAWLFRFDAETTWSASFPTDPDSHFFSNNSDALMVPPPLTLELARASERIVSTVFADPAAHLQHVWPCELAELEVETPSHACIEQFVTAMGQRIYRRPLGPNEVSRYLELVDDAATDRRGVELVLEAMLQSPHFLYRTELGDGEGRLTSHEVVSLLAFTVWDVAPDEELLALADAGLAESDYEALVAKVLDDERAEGMYARFFLDWFDLTELHALDKPEDPRWSPALAAAMEQEVADYVHHVMHEGSGTQDEVFASTQTVHDPALEAIYGATEVGPDGLVDHPEQQRAGILTLPGWLATNAEPRPTPIARGVFVRERILCQELPPIPPGVNPMVPPAQPGETTRERFDRHTTDPVCAGCHELIDPIGFLFSNYDSVGAYITEEAGQPVDSSGAIIGSQDIDDEYATAVDMLRRLASSDELTACVPAQMYTFVYGQPAEIREDECTIGELTNDYATSGRDVRALLSATMSRRLAAGQ